MSRDQARTEASLRRSAQFVCQRTDCSEGLILRKLARLTLGLFQGLP